MRTLHINKFTFLFVLGAYLLSACATPTAALPATQAAATPTRLPVLATEAPALFPEPAPTIDADVTLQIDLTKGGYPISPLIYGMTSAPVEILQELRLPLNSWGGNPNSRYNWKLGNAWNAARDFVYVNGDYSYKGKSAANDFIQENMAAGAATRLTIPTLGWVAKDTSSCSFPEPNGKCGMGGYARCDKPGKIADPHQTSVEAPPSFMGEWIDQLNKDKLPVEFFAMDNEPELWGMTHYDVHPTCTTYDEILQKFVDYAQVVKAKAPQGQIMGPVTCCWYFYWDTMAGKKDKLSHGNKDFLPWFLQNMAGYEQKNGQRLLDVLDIHYYPEGVYNDDTSPAVAAQRLRATRSLWDRKYKDESWIDKPVYLIPRMQELIANDYPDTKLAITEWNFGAEESLNGALAIADVLGIFGRERLDMAAYYRFPELNSPGYFAFKMFTNYDGNGGHFGDTAMQVTPSSNIDNLSAYAAVDSATGSLTLLVINKDPDRAYTAQVLADGSTLFKEGTLYRYDQSDLTGIRDEAIDPATLLGLDLPPYSLTLLVLEPGN